MRKLAICWSALLLAGCGSVRVLEHSESFADKISNLPQSEVIQNLDDTVDRPYRIARRSVFGKATLLSSDNAQAGVAIPLHLFATTPGSVTGNVGNLLDTYSIDVSPEVDGVTLGVLRQAYQAAIYPDMFPEAAKNLAAFIHSPDNKWLYWRNFDGSPACLRGTAFCSEAEPGMWPVGRGQLREFYVRDPELFAKFTLLTYGKSADSSRVTNNEGPGLINVGQRGGARRGDVRIGRKTNPVRHGTARVPDKSTATSEPRRQAAPRPVQSGDVVPAPELKPNFKINEFQMLQDSRRPPLSNPSITLNPQ